MPRKYRKKELMNKFDDSDNPNRRIYNQLSSCSHSRLDDASLNAYDLELTRIRFELLKTYGTGKKVLDLCCGSGAYLIPNLSIFEEAVGIDFSENMINMFGRNIGGAKSKDLSLSLGDARQIPIKSGTFDLIFSFSSLYYVPQLELVLSEIRRVLKPGGIVAIELGNIWSLNNYICSLAHLKEGHSKTYHVSYPKMLKLINASGLSIIKRRSFCILPMWGPTNRWLKIITSNRWKYLMGLKVFGRMIDEWFSTIWPLRYVAFRQLFICQK
jgi:ubiquinone/menaquinone biosynthesis C-methylase UbiE